MNLSWDYLRQSTAALEQHYHAGLAGGGGVPPTSSVLLNASSLLDANVAINNVSNSIATTTTTTNVSNNSEANVAQPGDDLSWIKREEMRLSTNGQNVVEWSSEEHSQFVALLQLYTDPMLHLPEITAKLNAPNKSQRDVELHLRAYFARFMDTASQTGVLPPTVQTALQSSMPVIRASSIWHGMSNEFSRAVLQTSGGFASLLADHFSNIAPSNPSDDLLLFGSLLPNTGATGAADPNELRPVTDWSNEVGEQVKSTLTENMQMIQQMQANLSARQLDANIDLMKSLYQRLRWAVQATDTFAPKQMQPLPLQLNTTLIRNALAGVAQATPLVPSGVNKSQMDALRAKASAQLDRLQQQKQQPQAAATTTSQQPKARAAPARKRAAAGAGGAARRRKKRPEYEESDEEDELEDDDDDEDD